MFIVLCSDILLVLWTHEISLHKTIHMISTGDPPSPVLVIILPYWPIISLLILSYFVLFSNFFFFFNLVHDYTLCFIVYLCYGVGYYTFNSIWPYYIVIFILSQLNSQHYCTMTTNMSLFTLCVYVLGTHVYIWLLVHMRLTCWKSKHSSC